MDFQKQRTPPTDTIINETNISETRDYTKLRFPSLSRMQPYATNAISPLVAQLEIPVDGMEAMK